MYRFYFIFALIIVLFTGCKESPSNEIQVEKEAEQLEKEMVDTKATLAEINDEILNNPESPNGYYKRAFYFKENYEYAKAIEDINRSLKLTPDVPALMFLKAEILYNQAGAELNPQLYEQAEIYLLETIKLDTTYVKAYVLEGRINMAKPNFEKAMANFNSAIINDKYYAPAYFYKGMLFELMAEKEKAKSSYQTAVELDGQYYDALHHLGNMLAANNDPQALIYYNAALDIDPESYEVLRNKGLFLKNNGEYEEAIECFSKILEFIPDNEECYYNIGVVYVDSYRDDMAQDQKDSIINNAIQNFESAVQLNDKYADALYNLGWIHQYKGEKKTAIKYYQQIMEFEPYHEPTIAALKEIDN